MRTEISKKKQYACRNGRRRRVHFISQQLYYNKKFFGGKSEPTVKPQNTTVQELHDTIDEYALKIKGKDFS